MLRNHRSKYPWPASAITPAEMALLHQARELSPELQPITRLLARAVRETYGRFEAAMAPATLPEAGREAA